MCDNKYISFSGNSIYNRVQNVQMCNYSAYESLKTTL